MGAARLLARPRPCTASWFACLPRADGKTFKKPRRPFEKERLDAELKLVGEYGLRNKRELWRVQVCARGAAAEEEREQQHHHHRSSSTTTTLAAITIQAARGAGARPNSQSSRLQLGAPCAQTQVVLSKIRNAARTLLTLDEKDPKRIFEGQALMRRLYKYGLLNETQDKLDYALALQPNDFLERRLQTLVFKQGLAKSIHHARVLIKQRHIRCAHSVPCSPRGPEGAAEPGPAWRRGRGPWGSGGAWRDDACAAVPCPCCGCAQCGQAGGQRAVLPGARREPEAH